MRIVRLLALSAVALAFSTSAVAADVIPVGEFRAVELHHGGRVIVRHGTVQRVSVVSGDPRCLRIRTEGGRTLIIDRVAGHCRDGHRVAVEVVTPHLSRVTVSNGGTVQTLGSFPAQPSIEAAVEQGGMIDIRSIAADDVTASVYSGGGVLTTSRRTLTATVREGGAVTYWGGVSDVRKSVRHGGAITRGAADDAEKPLSELGGGVPPVPPLPPIPPRPPSM